MESDDLPVSSGYSGAPLPKKLGLKPGHRVALVGAPDDWTIAGAGADVEVRRDLAEHANVIIAFVRSLSELRRAAALVDSVGAEDALWIAWPRKAAGHVSEVTEQSLRDQLLPMGLVDNKVAAVDADWSGLRFVWRREERDRVRGRTEP